MAIFGLGAFYEDDMTDAFLTNGVGCVGWSFEEAPALHKIIRHIKVGDIVYIKSHPPSEGLIIKAIGIVSDDEVHLIEDVGEACLKIRWIWDGYEVVGRVNDRYNVRLNTLYEETNPEIQNRVLELLLSRLR